MQLTTVSQKMDGNIIHSIDILCSRITDVLNSDLITTLLL